MINAVELSKAKKGWVLKLQTTQPVGINRKMAFVQESLGES